MMEKTQISWIQLFLLLSGFHIGSTVLLSPSAGAGRDAWLAMILGGAGGTLLMWSYAVLSMLNPSKTLVEILRERMGKIVGTILSFLYVWYFIHLASLVFRDFGEFLCTTTYLETPMVVVIGLFAVVLLYTVNSGIEVLGRLSELLVPVIPVAISIISFSLFTINDFTAVLPILENGLMPVLKGAFGAITFPYGETVAFLMLFPHLNRKDKLKKTVVISAVLSTLLGLLVFFRDLFVIGGDLIGRSTFIPHLTSLLIPEFNVEPLLDINLLIGGGIKISVCVYAAAKALCQITGVQDYRGFTRAVLTFAVVLAIWAYDSVLELFAWTQKVYGFYVIPFQVLIPLLLLLLSLIRKGKPQGEVPDKEGNNNAEAVNA